tara:strand:+ start:186 stop:782 length:597 start_codon:yes stop_codon:yes gene_type:complete
MIAFNNIDNGTPYLEFKKLYDLASKNGQKNIEVACIASYSKSANQVNSRFVNLKYLNKKDFIFFTNYNSPKAEDFREHNQISAVIYWDSINFQIRIKAEIQKTSREFSKAYFSKRDKKKNALAISSNQSNKISSFDDVYKNYEQTLKSKNLKECPEYWGGYLFTPFYFEFWEGHESRLNKRDAYEFQNKQWNHCNLQP